MLLVSTRVKLKKIIDYLKNIAKYVAGKICTKNKKINKCNTNFILFLNLNLFSTYF